MAHHLFKRKPLSLVHEEMKGENRLRRVLGPWSLTSLGVGCIIGTGIFVLTGVAAHHKAGPALMVSFVVAGMACIFSALCYAEFASMAPVAGSAYTYAYVTLGEMFAWIIGWDLVLEYTVASATVAHGWSSYFQNLIGSYNLHVPKIVSTAPFEYNLEEGVFHATGAWFDLPALVIVAILTTVLVIGIRESARFNNLMVGIKVVIVLMVIAVGAFYVDPANWQPFAPFGWAGLSLFGKPVFGQTGADGMPVGMLAGAAIIFFAYIGFDSVSTHAEEARRPQRDVPFGIVASLVICTILYIAVTFVLTGMVRYDQIDIHAPVAVAFQQVGLGWARRLIALGAVAGMTSVMLVLMLSQPRVLLAMARDGLLPEGFFGDIHPRFRTPWKSTIVTGLMVGTMASLIPLGILAELVSIGTLLAFVIVCLAVLVMRYIHPQAERPFRCPWVPVIPILGVILCLILMLSLPFGNWLRLLAWMVAGMLIYVFYGRHRSVLARQRLADQAANAGCEPITP
ncbi:MAG: amino acid permease [Planctomycetes bacterium]|jgi:APA family basic amino acid/polyamine antiporter|nr:amino acid permease [Planctomycetota bacterium]